MVKASRAKGRSEYTMLLFLLSANCDVSSRSLNEVNPGLSNSPAALLRYKKITKMESHLILVAPGKYQRFQIIFLHKHKLFHHESFISLLACYNLY